MRNVDIWGGIAPRAEQSRANHALQSETKEEKEKPLQAKTRKKNSSSFIIMLSLSFQVF